MDVQLNIRKVDSTAVLDVAGELDLYTSPKLKTAIEELMGEGHTRLVVNLTQTSYLDSTALSILTAALKQLRASGGNLALIYSQPQIDRMFSITGLNEVFPIFGSEEEALSAARDWLSEVPPA